MELLLNKNDKDYPDVAVVISDVENLKRNLLLFTQIKDLKIPTILVINMADRMDRKGISLDVEAMEKKLDTKIALVSTRKNTGIERIKELIADYKNVSSKPLLDPTRISPAYFERLKKGIPTKRCVQTMARYHSRCELYAHRKEAYPRCYGLLHKVEG